MLVVTGDLAVQIDGAGLVWRAIADDLDPAPHRALVFLRGDRRRPSQVRRRRSRTGTISSAPAGCLRPILGHVVRGRCRSKVREAAVAALLQGDRDSSAGTAVTGSAAASAEQLSLLADEGGHVRRVRVVRDGTHLPE